MLISIVIFIGAYSCNCEDDVLENNTQLTTQSSIRSYEEALAIAKSSISMIEEAHATTRFGNTEHRSIDLSNSMVITDKTTRYANQSDTALYVFNFKDDNGFALVSANPNTEGLIAVTESGNYKDCITENTAFAEYVSMAKRMIRDSIKPYPKEPEGHIPMIKRDTLSREQRGPYISVQWGQDYPEGVFFPNTKAGCVNVAILQILSYYKYPKQITLTYQNADSAFIKLDWDKMRLHTTSSSMLETSCSPYYHKAHSDIAHLCRQIAEYTHSQFIPEELKFNYNLYNYYYYGDRCLDYALNTKASIDDAHNAFSLLGYTTSNILDYKPGCTCTPLSRYQLIYMRGRDENSEYGHAWVVDGFKKYVVKTESYETIDFTTTTITTIYNHINWGFNGKCNGYFLDNIFAPQKGKAYDNNKPKNDVYNYKVGISYFTINNKL